MISSINSINNNISIPNDPFFVQVEFRDLLEQFRSDPTPEHAKALLDFLNKPGVRSQMEMVGNDLNRKPFPDMDIDQYIDGAKAAIVAYLENPNVPAMVLQFGKNLGYVIGAYDDLGSVLQPLGT